MAKKCKIRKPTLTAIKAKNKAKGGYFFSPQTMKFWNDTMKSFKVTCEGSKIYVVRKRDGKKWKFNPKTGDIGPT